MKHIGIIGSRDSFKTILNYYEAVEACGALAQAVTVPANLTGLDGLIIPGGADIDPALYGEDNKACQGVNRDLDDLEIGIIEAAVRRKIPILGICRGHQILNVYFGGSLFQDIEHAERHRHIDTGDQCHICRTDRNGFLYDIYKQQDFCVNSAHHQAIKKPGNGIKIIQYCDDGTAEAICHESLPVYGVQWHPERMCLKNARDDTVDGLLLFQWFISGGLL